VFQAGDYTWTLTRLGDCFDLNKGATSIAAATEAAAVGITELTAVCPQDFDKPLYIKMPDLPKGVCLFARKSNFVFQIVLKY